MPDDMRKAKGTWSALKLAFGVAASCVVLGQAAAQPSPALIEARRHMLDASINSLTFRSMEALFDTLRVDAQGQPSVLQTQLEPLDFVYSFDGEERAAEAFLERTYSNSLLIIKDDKIVAERYLNNTNESTHFLSM